MHSLGIVQWNSTRRDHPGNPEGVSRSGPVRRVCRLIYVCSSYNPKIWDGVM